MTKAICPFCGHDEARERCCWPMPDSPLEFFGPSTWLDDDAIDREIIAGRLAASEFTTIELADLIGVHDVTIRKWARRGKLFPTRYEPYDDNRGSRAVYSAEKVAGVLIARGA